MDVDSSRRGAAATPDDDHDDVGSPRLRPQSLMLTFLGEHVLGHEIAVFSGSIIEVLGRVGVAEHATRSTLSRMVQRGLLQRQPRGRRTYFALTRRSEAILADGGERIWRMGAVNVSTDTAWTLIGFSFPDSWQRERHSLRSRLTWAGFAPLQSGLWLAPSEIDVVSVLSGLGLDGHVKVFIAEPRPPTDIGQLVHEAFDLDGVAARYHQFMARWHRPEHRVAVDDPLALTLRITTEWLGIVREDPRLPSEHLPDDWPAVEAQHLFHDLHGVHIEAAEAMAAELLDSVPAERASSAGSGEAPDAQ